MLSIDRFEGEYAICIDENENTLKILIAKLPSGVKEGSILKKKDDLYILDDTQTNKRKENIKKLQNNLWE